MIISSLFFKTCSAFVSRATFFHLLELLDYSTVFLAYWIQEMNCLFCYFWLHGLSLQFQVQLETANVWQHAQLWSLSTGSVAMLLPGTETLMTSLTQNSDRKGNTCTIPSLIYSRDIFYWFWNVQTNRHKLSQPPWHALTVEDSVRIQGRSEIHTPFNPNITLCFVISAEIWVF